MERVEATEIQQGGQLALILAAERLFAERGIEAVSLRQINQAANHRNMSAAHYHFGSREGLLEAVLMYRLPLIDARRRALLSRPDAKRDLRFFLEAFILPLSEELAPRPEGNCYIRFMQQYERYRGDYDFARRLTPAGIEIYNGIERLIGYLPAEVRGLRITYFINLIHAILASAEERIGRGDLIADAIGLITENAIDMLTAALAAPPSAETIDILDGH